MVHEDKRPLHKDLVDELMIDFIGILHRSQIEPFAFLLEEGLEFEDEQVLGWLRGILKKTPSIDGRRALDLVEVLKQRGFPVEGVGEGPVPRESNRADKKGFFDKGDS